MLHVKKNIKNYDDLHKKGCTNKFYVLLYMQTVYIMLQGADVSIQKRKNAMIIMYTIMKKYK